MNALGIPLAIYSIVFTALGVVAGWLAYLSFNTTALWGNMLWNYIVCLIMVVVAICLIGYGLVSLWMSAVLLAN
jgi:hypothetical protein